MNAITVKVANFKKAAPVTRRGRKEYSHAWVVCYTCKNGNKMEWPGFASTENRATTQLVKFIGSRLPKGATVTSHEVVEVQEVLA